MAEETKEREFTPCNCLNTTETRILKKLREDHPTLLIDEDQSSYINKSLMLSNGRWILYHEYKYSSTFKRTNGEMSKPKNTIISITPSFCGFCGKPLYAPKDGK